MEFLHTNRVVILVDMDCFYCQVEENLNPKLSGKPIAVVQYNQWGGGGIIAVNYPARERGVIRHMRGAEAKAKCPDIELVSVPCVRGKADISKYRDAGKRVVDVLQTFTDSLERASVDEAYLDVTSVVLKKIKQSRFITVDHLPNTHVVGFNTADFLETVYGNDCLSDSNLMLAMGGVIAEEFRAAVYEKTGYQCSAGVAHNKVLAKLACGMHKPNQQTLLPQDSVRDLYKNLPVRKIRSLGGKFGYKLTEELEIKTMGELIKFSEKELIQRYDEKTGSWLYRIARGINLETVTTRLVSKSIGCCKKFPGRTALIKLVDVMHWISQLSEEISKRLEKDLEENNRIAKQMVISFVQVINKKDVSSSRSHPLISYESKKIAFDILKVVKKGCLRSDKTFHLKFLGISATKFESNRNVPGINSYFIMNRKINSEAKTRCTNHPDVGEQCSDMPFIKNVENGDKSDNTETDVSKDNTNNSYANSSASDSSTFSAETQILSYNAEKNIYPDICTKYSPTFTNEIQILKRQGYCHDFASYEQESDADSISDEIIGPLPDERIDKQHMSGSISYFRKYFDCLKGEKAKFSKGDRNFDTSLSFLDNSETACESKVSDTGLNVAMAERDDISPGLYHTACSYLPSDTKKLCKECNESVLASDFTSHMDYHFALKLVQDKAHIYKATTNNYVPSGELKKQNNSVKRKHTNEKCMKLTSFLMLNADATGVDNLSELCVECNRKIPVAEVLIHADYHLAKKLHLEMNMVRTSHMVKNINTNLTKSQADSKNYKKQSVFSFFKPI